MNTAIIENVNKLGKSSYESVKELYTINTNLAEQLIEQQLALVSAGVEYTANQLKLVGEAKNYKESISGQTEIVTDLSGKVQGIARNTLDIFNETRDQMNAWFEKGVKEAEKGIREATKIVPLTTKAA
jgi:phasin family protein